MSEMKTGTIMTVMFENDYFNYISYGYDEYPVCFGDDTIWHEDIGLIEQRVRPVYSTEESPMEIRLKDVEIAREKAILYFRSILRNKIKYYERLLADTKEI